ncbi:MAG TPA: nuclear transport factor 2 family protein [Bacteroidales bacterium]|nr:nuclear transport factor 2 family protein [Bacteroidales bacterium]
MENKPTGRELAELVFKAMNRRDFSILEPYLTEDVVFDFPGAGRIEGFKRVLIFLKALLRKYPVLVFDVSEVIIDEDRMCAIWTNEGKDIDGNSYSNSGNTVLNLSEGKITFISDYFKDTSFANK